MKEIIYFLEKKYVFTIFATLWKIILDLSYTLYVGKYFEYSGFLNNFDSVIYYLSWILYIFGVLLTPKILNKPSDFFITLFLIIVIAPLLSFISFNAIYNYIVVWTAFISFIFIYFYCNFSFFKNIKIKYIKRGPSILKIVSFLSIFYLFFWYIISGAVSNFNLDFSKVYDFREINAELTNIGVLSYLNSWVYQVFTVALMGYALLQRNYILFFFLAIIQIFFYGVNAHKSILFAPIIIYIIYFYFSKTKALSIIPIMLIILVGGMLIFSFNDPYSIYPSMFIRRTFFVPTHLTFTYFEFFSTHSYNYWSNSFLEFFISRKYEDGISKEIGKYLNTNTNANNGFISSGYAQLGYFGVMFYVFIFSFLLKFCDYLAKQIGNNWFCICLLVIPIKNLFLSSDLLTTLLTHGLLLSIIVLILVRTPEKSRA